MITTQGRVYEQRGTVYIKTNRPGVDNLSDDVTILWHDARHITPSQMNLAWLLMTDIAVDTAGSKDYKEDVYKQQRLDFTNRNLELLQGRLFHLSEATVSEASAFINMLVEIIIENGIETRKPLREMCEDIQHMVYVSLLNKKCAVCNRKAELHHVDAIGMGYSRREKPQIGARVLPLAHEYHMEIHNIGNDAFMAKYHLEPVRLDDRLAKVYNLTEEARRVGDYGQQAV